jgi:hypothetical protein
MTNYTQQFADAFEARFRSNGEKFVTLRDDAPAWATDIAYAAHDGSWLCDWRMWKLSILADDMAREEALGAEFEVFEWADNAADIYNAELTKWLASSLRNVEYVEDARNELDFDNTSDILGMIRVGQVYALEQMALCVIHKLEMLKEESEAAA